MSFPKLEVPILSCTLPVSGRKVKYRPYTVKEDKLLNLVMTETDEVVLAKDMMDSVLALAEACTYGEDISSYAVADIEYIFLKIKSASSGATTKKIYECKLKNEDDEECGADNVVEIDLDTVELSGEMPESLIKLNDTLSLSMKIPSFGEIRDALNNDDKEVVALQTMARAVDMVLDGEEVFADFDNQDLIDNILVNLTKKQTKQLEEYFNAIPVLVFRKEFKCKGCGSTHQLEVKHLVNFFD